MQNYNKKSLKTPPPALFLHRFARWCQCCGARGIAVPCAAPPRSSPLAEGDTRGPPGTSSTQKFAHFPSWHHFYSVLPSLFFFPFSLFFIFTFFPLSLFSFSFFLFTFFFFFFSFSLFSFSFLCFSLFFPFHFFPFHFFFFSLFSLFFLFFTFFLYFFPFHFFFFFFIFNPPNPSRPPNEPRVLSTSIPLPLPEARSHARDAGGPLLPSCSPSFSPPLSLLSLS